MPSPSPTAAAGSMENNKMSDQIQLGKLIEGDAQRDAIHVAIAPVVADEHLKPGQPITFVKLGDCSRVMACRSAAIGIVDPYLADDVYEGDSFWMFLYPNTVTGMRHHWSHPSFFEAKSGEDVDTAASVAWLTAYARHFEMGYSDLIQAAREYAKGGHSYCLGFDTPDVAYDNVKEFWQHYERVTGERVNDHESTIFRCAC